MKTYVYRFLTFMVLLAGCGFGAGDVALPDTYSKANKLTSCEYPAIPKQNVEQRIDLLTSFRGLHTYARFGSPIFGSWK